MSAFHRAVLSAAQVSRFSCSGRTVVRSEYYEGVVVETGVAEIMKTLDAEPGASVIVFATPTTVEEGTYREQLLKAGVEPERIVQQACPGLPDAISNDFSGDQAESLLQTYVPTALARFEALPQQVTAFLGCTHYGYQAGLFERLLKVHAGNADVLNPNVAAAASIIGKIGSPPGNGAVAIRFVTPYAIPEKPLASLSRYLGDKAPATVAALRNFLHDPDLYRDPAEVERWKQRDPITTAKEIASLDMLSNGRFIFGIGGGVALALLNIARHGTATHVERTVRGYRRALKGSGARAGRAPARGALGELVVGRRRLPGGGRQR